MGSAFKGAYRTDHTEPRPLWTDSILAVALEVAKGRDEYLVPKSPEEDARSYARRVELAQLKYPMVVFVPEDLQAFVKGQVIQARIDKIPVETRDLSIPKVSLEITTEVKAAARILKNAGYSSDPALEFALALDREDIRPSQAALLGIPGLRAPVEQH